MSTRKSNKRKALKKTTALIAGSVAIASWKTPLINSIILPAHAKTSCSAQDVIGVWEISVQGDNEPITFSLFADGTGSKLSPVNNSLDNVVTWLLEGNVMSIKYDSLIRLADDERWYSGVLSESCDSFSGVVSCFCTETPSFTARKIT